MEIRDPVLGAQIFEVEPDRRTLAPRHCGDVDRRQLAAECLDHDVSHFERIARVGRLVPVLDDDAADCLARAIQRQRRAQFLERMQIVDEHAHLPAVLARQLARETPAHADVAEIVDHRAEDVAGDRRGRGSGLFGDGITAVAEDMVAWVAEWNRWRGVGFCRVLLAGDASGFSRRLATGASHHSMQQGSNARGML